MQWLLALSRAIDTLNQRVGRLAAWLVLLACLVSAANAAVRYAFDTGSNAWLEVQWYMFAGIFLLGAADTLNRNEHVRVDLFYGRLSVRAQIWVDLVGGVLFLMPACLLIAWMSWPFFWESFRIHEGSANPGGLLRWPVKLLLPLGFVLLALQGLSEIVKRIGALSGHGVVPPHYEKTLQ
jgi:TRAP-type mannitol/chloroaromatic compound transport system permease small subunit